MTVERLSLSNFRNIESANLSLNSKLNFVLGDNGSGKTSCLESLFFLGHGKSFRTSNNDDLVREGEDTLAVNAKDSNLTSLGISKANKDKIKIRVNGESKTKLSELARYLAVQVITPESFKLFWGGPKERRRFIDLGLFHVEHEYGFQWQSFSKILKHRNALLRNAKVRAKVDNLDYWTELFCKHSKVLNDYREKYIVKLVGELSSWLVLLLPNLTEELEINLFNGWNNKDVDLEEILQKNSMQEQRYGYSIAGAHKFDLVCRYKGKLIDQVLSRGQQKLFLIALIFAQASIINKSVESATLVLVDDIGAELDSTSRERFATAIDSLDTQLIISAIDESAIEPIANKIKNYTMFHVKHGVIKENKIIG